MKKEILRLLVWITLGSLCVTGCYPSRVVVASPPGEVIVTEAPPRARYEVRTVAPSTSHVWVEGYWLRRHGRWLWVRGHWELGPRVSAVWVPGHWDRTGHGWEWRPGHWD